jgi:predicted nuclease of restriction endonuclease-like (RecB) superfamily
MENNINKPNSQLFTDIRFLIDESRQKLAQTVNSSLTILYWKIGKRINEEILGHERAAYGKLVIKSLSRQLTDEYGKGFSNSALTRMYLFHQHFSTYQIVATLSQQLSWSHFVEIIPLKNELERDFYIQMCRIENWSVRTLRAKIQSMLFERTAISQKPEELAKLELEALREEDLLSPDLVFRDPYLLDFLGLKNTYLEKDLEKAILLKLEEFLLELGRGFAFMERQKRMIIDHKDYNLDLLFYHRKMKRLVAIDLKIGQFEPGFKGQMELYLRWLEKHEMEDGEEKPIGLILCTEGNYEQIELLQLDKSNIKVAKYITEFLPKELLKEKLHQFMIVSRKQIENQGE